MSNKLDCGSCGIVLWALATSISAFAQATASVAGGGPPVIRVSSELVLVDAVVYEKKSGLLIGNLDANDFILSEDSIPQNITYLSHDQLPLSLVFMFDLTETVRPILKPLANSANTILGHLKPQDEVAVMVFDSHTELLQDFTTDHSLISMAVERAAAMKSDDGTFIHEDVYEAIDQALQSKSQSGRRVLLWLTDGTSNVENSASKKLIGRHAHPVLHTKQEANEKLFRSRVTVAALIDRSPSTDLFVAAMDMSPFAFIGGRLGDINKYADETGGPVLHTNNKEAVEKLATLLDQIRGSYTFGYRPSSATADHRFHVLRLRLSSSLRQKHPELRGKKLVIRTKQGYYR